PVGQLRNLYLGFTDRRQSGEGTQIVLLVKLEVFPLRRILGEAEDVVRRFRQTQQTPRLDLFDMDVAPHRKIDQGRCDVSHIRLVVDECAELGGGHSSGGLVMDDVRTLLWIATLFIPLVVREPENQKRNYEWGPPNECRQLLVGPAWTAGDVSRRPTDSDCQTLVGIESLCRSEGDFILVDFRARGGSSLSHRSGVDGDAGRFDICG